MALQTKIADLVRIRPEDFSKRTIEALEDNLNEKYANKVIQNIGLAICVYDILWAGDDTGIISQGDGYANVNVEFRLVVFHPFKGEVMNARIRNSTPAGINLKTDFFDDIFIPFDMLPEGCEYNPQQEIWVWNYDETRLHYDNNEIVRFQVTEEEWHDQAPGGPREETEENLTPPYRIKGTMAQEGLGVCLWWDS